ncbi:hypothetical protein N0V82_000908 [Gnomoniopsis sp. IMI 355080]|nr:hypothetical protein N0V82_000908 [Gnomoniopsis sp. IMI 355080]
MASPPLTDRSLSAVRRKVPTSSRTPLRKETLHSVEMWESIRDMIKELYMDQNKPLREVSRILEAERNFIARLLELQKSRESLGKPSTFVRSGQKLEQVRIERTIRRSKARALAKHESSKDACEMPVPVLGVPSVSVRLLPTGIECRTPSPEPQRHHRSDPMFEYCDILVPESHARSSQEVYSFDAAADDQQRQESYLEHLKTYDIATRKLRTVQVSWATPNSSDQPAGLHAFRYRNVFLAVLEPAIIGKDQLCVKYLQNYAATFLDCPELSLFTRCYVLPVLEHDGRNSETAALVTEADNFIQRGIDLLHLSTHTINLIERAASLNHDNLLEEDVFATQYEDVINPAILNGPLVADVPSGPFDMFNFQILEEILDDSNGSSPTTASSSASEYATSPSTLFGGSSPATEAEVIISNRLGDDRLTKRCNF